MPEPPATTDSYDRYLHLLGLPALPPSIDALAELTAAHLTRVPFENVSKLYYRREAASRGLPSLETFLDRVERYRFGGTCYSINYQVHGLLAHLGYDVSLCGADMSAPNVHIVNIVALGRRRYLVDVGYAAPFLAPLPLDLEEDHEVAWGGDRYVLKPADVHGRSTLETYRQGTLVHGYVVNPVPRAIEDFANVVAESYSDRAAFMHALLVARFFPQRSITLRNLTVIEAGPTSAGRARTVGRKDLPDLIEAEFGIPRECARRALDGVEFTSPA
jgi:N-hydroxyarylamine O-acetyltransferase